MSTTCPQCGGNKELFGFARSVDANGRSNCVPGKYPCPICKGSGQITPDHAQRIERGKKMRGERLAKGLSLHEAAKGMGMSPVELSELEQGGLPGGMSGVN